MNNLHSQSITRPEVPVPLLVDMEGPSGQLSKAEFHHRGVEGQETIPGEEGGGPLEA